MKPESFSDVEVEWEPLHNIYSRGSINHNLYPSKPVIALIKQIESGKFPTLEVLYTIDGPTVTTKSQRAYEAYVRCHFSRIPVVFVEKETNDRDPV